MYDKYSKYERCGNCKYWNGRRKLRSNGSPDLSSGTCTYKNSYCYGKDNNGFGTACNKYERCYEFLEIINKEKEKEQKRENERLAREREREEAERKSNEERVYREQQRELHRQQQEIENERKKLEAERRALEYATWYASLTPEEKAEEDERKRLAAIEEANRREEEERKKRIEQEERAEKERQEKIKQERKKELLIPIVRNNRKMIGLMIGFSLVLMLIFLCIIRFIDEKVLETAESYDAYEAFTDKINWIIFGFSAVDVIIFIVISIVFQVYNINSKTVIAYIAAGIGLWVLSLIPDMFLEIIAIDHLNVITTIMIIAILIYLVIFTFFIRVYLKRKKYITENKSELDRLFAE